MLTLEQDKRAVEGMARCGISVEELIESFPKFSADDIKAIYDDIHKNESYSTSVSMKINCS